MDIFKLVGSVFVDTDKANDSLSKVDKKAEGTGGKFSNLLGTIGKVGAGIVTTVGSMAVAAGATLVKMTEDTREYRTEMGKLQTAFETAGHSNKAATQTYKDLQAILGDTGQAVEASNNLAQLCKNEEELKKWTDICTGVYATFGDGIPIEGLAEAANETAKVGAVTGSLADALNWVGVSEDEFNQKLEKCNTEQERQALITSTLTGLYSKASEQYKKTNKDVMDANSAQEKLNASMAAIGAVVEPVIIMAKSKLGDLINRLIPVAETIAIMVIPAVMSFAEKALPMLFEVIEKMMPPIINLIEYLFPVLIGLMETLLPPVIQIVETLLPVIVDLLNILLPPLMDIINMLLPVLIQLLPPILSLLQPIINLLNPIIQLCMALLKPLIQLLDIILPPLIEVITFLVNVVLWRLQTAFQTVADVISNVVNIAVSYVKEQIAILKDIFGNVIEFIKNVFTGNWKAAFENVLNILSNIFQLMINRVKLPVNIIIGVINGMLSGITSGINAVIKALNKLKIDVPDWVTDLTGVKDFGFNIKTIKTPQIPLLAEGANVLEGGRAVINEAGAELVDLPTGAKVMPLTSNGKDFLKIDILVKRIEQILELLTAYVPEIAANTKLKFVLPTGEIVEATLSRINNGLAEIEDITVRGGTI